MLAQWLAEQCGGGQEVDVWVPLNPGAHVAPILAPFKCRVAVAGKHNIKEEANLQ